MIWSNGNEEEMSMIYHELQMTFWKWPQKNLK